MVNRLILARLKKKPVEEHMKSIIKKLNSVELMLLLTCLSPSIFRDKLVKAMDEKGLNGSRMVKRVDKRKEFLDSEHSIRQEDMIKH